MSLTLEMLEKLGNTYPSQKEIDSLETLLKRFSRRKETKKRAGVLYQRNTDNLIKISRKHFQNIHALAA